MPLDKKLITSLINITSKAAIECYKFVGKGDKKIADKAATDSMRKNLNVLEKLSVDEKKIKNIKNS